MATKIIICGAAGRMGGRLIALAGQDRRFSLAGAVDIKAQAMGQVSIVDDLTVVIASGDVVIDFTNAQATMEHLAVCRKAGKALVVGSTGITDQHLAALREAARDIPIIFSPNMSMGVNLLFSLVREVARAIPGFDVEIVELHHNQKKDAPSGTAVKLAENIAGALGRDLGKAGIYGREGIVGPRTKEEIGVMAVRGGDIVGDHTVYFIGTGERIELTHRAHSRDVFAAGALSAAHWAAGKKPGLYDMQDVLGLKK